MHSSIQSSSKKKASVRRFLSAIAVAIIIPVSAGGMSLAGDVERSSDRSQGNVPALQQVSLAQVEDAINALNAEPPNVQEALNILNKLSSSQDAEIAAASPVLNITRPDGSLLYSSQPSSADSSQILFRREPQGWGRCIGKGPYNERATVMFDVTAKGSTTNIRIVESSDPCVDRSAKRAIKQWKYKPKIEDGKAVPRYDVRTDFTFQSL